MAQDVTEGRRKGGLEFGAFCSVAIPDREHQSLHQCRRDYIALFDSMPMPIHNFVPTLIVFWLARSPAHAFEDHSKYNEGDQEAKFVELKGNPLKLIHYRWCVQEMVQTQRGEITIQDVLACSLEPYHHDSC